MNRKDGFPVVEPADRVDVGVRQQAAPQRCGCVIGREPGRQNQADASAAPGEHQRALDEHLIAIDVPAALMRDRFLIAERTVSLR